MTGYCSPTSEWFRKSSACSFRPCLDHFTHLAAREIFNTKSPGEFLNLARGYALDVDFLNDLDESCFATFSFGHEEGNISTVTHFRNHEIHRSHSCIQASGAIAAAVTFAVSCPARSFPHRSEKILLFPSV